MIGAVFPIQRNAVADIGEQREDDHDFHGVSRGTKAAYDFPGEIAEDEADGAIAERVEAGAQKIKRQELRDRHFHAARQRGGHDADARKKFGDEQRGAAAFVEGFGGAEDAVFRIHRNPAKKFQDSPAGAGAQNVEQRIGQQHRGDRAEKHRRAVERVRRDGRASSDESQGPGTGTPIASANTTRATTKYP